MSRRAKDLTSRTDPRFGPWAPMRGARGEAEAIMQETRSPWRSPSDQSPLVPGRGNIMRYGADMTTTRRGTRGGRWRA